MMNAEYPSTASTRWWEPLTALWLLLALVMMTSRLVSTHWVPNLNIIPIIMIFGYIAGLALGQSRFSTPIVISMAVCYGLFIILWQLGTILGLDVSWNDKLFFIWLRETQALTNLFQHKDVSDPFLYMTITASIYWSISLHAGFALNRRGNPWEVTIPAGIVTVFTHLSDPYYTDRIWYLLIYLILALLIIARLNYLHLNTTWQQRSSRIPTYISWDLSRAALLIAIPFVLIAWAVPATIEALPSAQKEWTKISKPIKGQLDHLFASLQGSVGIISDTYGDSLNLSKGTQLTDDIVFYVEAPAYPPLGIRYYWRGRVYDHYTYGNWGVSGTTTVPISPDTFYISQESIENPWTVTTLFTPLTPMRTVYSLPQPIFVDHKGKAQILGDPGGGASDILAILADPYLRPGDLYEVTSLMPNVSIKQIKETTSDYPTWITEHYLQLPDTITPRTRILAQRLAEGQDSKYDIVTSVTNYLRNNITYQETIETPPVNQERLDWLLFDYKKGFCQYYASAEVILLRILGIPARLAVGYAAGEAQVLQTNSAQRTTYTVRQRDFHAWPEVYFPKVGWLIFEPTTSQRPLERFSGEFFPSLNPQVERKINIDDLVPEHRRNSMPVESENALPENENKGQVNFWSNPAVRISGFIIVILLLSLAMSPIGQKYLRSTLPMQLQTNMIRLGIQPPQFLEHWALQTVAPRRSSKPMIIRLTEGLTQLGIKPPLFMQQWADFASLSPLTRAYLEINHALKRLGKDAPPSATPGERAASLVQLLPKAQETIQYLTNEYVNNIYNRRIYLADTTRGAVKAGSEIRTMSIIAQFQNFLKQIKDRLSALSYR